MFNDEVPSGAIDKPDERLFQAEHMLGDIFEGELPKKVSLLKTKASDQGGTSRCTAYALTHVHEILNALEHREEFKFSPEEQWRNQLKYPGTAKEGVGDYLTSALKALRKYGLMRNGKKHEIINYARVVNDPLTIKKYLAAGYPLFTGAPVTNSNFRKAKHEGVWSGIDGEVVNGHAFAIVAYETHSLGTEYAALNSYGPTWGKFGDGTFIIKEKDLGDLFTIYVVFDASDLRHIFKDVTEKSPMSEAIELCLKEGLIRGYGDEVDPKNREFRPNNGLSRAEAAQLIWNLYQKLK